MLSLSAKIRENKGEESRSRGNIPAVLYGPEIKPQSIELDLSEFEKVYQEAGESSLIDLKAEDPSAKASSEPRPNSSGQVKTYKVLIHEIQKNSVSGEIIHVDFYQPNLTKEVEVAVPIIFEGEAMAVKDLGGTLVKEIQEIEVKALPQNLPHEIKVSVDKLKTFENEVLVKDLEVPENVKVSREPDEIIAKVVEPTKMEEELEKPVEEEKEGVEKVEEGEEKEGEDKKGEKEEGKEEEKKE